MAFLRAHINGWMQAMRFLPGSFVLYFISLLSAGLFSASFKSLLERKAGQSLLVNNKLDRFNFEFIADFMNNFGDNMSILFDQTGSIIFFYVLFSILASAGIAYLITKEKSFSLGAFFKGGGQYFISFFFLNALFLILHFIVLFIIFQILKLWMGGSFDIFKIESDAQLFIRAQILLPFYILAAGFIGSWKRISELKITERNDYFIIGSVLEGFRNLLQKPLSGMLLFLVNTLVLVIAGGLVYLFRSFLSGSNFGGLLIIFLITQLFILFRMLLKFQRSGSWYDFSN